MVRWVCVYVLYLYPCGGEMDNLLFLVFSFRGEKDVMTRGLANGPVADVATTGDLFYFFHRLALFSLTVVCW